MKRIGRPRLRHVFRMFDPCLSRHVSVGDLGASEILMTIQEREIADDVSAYRCAAGGPPNWKLRVSVGTTSIAFAGEQTVIHLGIVHSQAVISSLFAAK